MSVLMKAGLTAFAVAPAGALATSASGTRPADGGPPPPNTVETPSCGADHIGVSLVPAVTAVIWMTLWALHTVMVTGALTVAPLGGRVTDTLVAGSGWQ